MTRIDLGKCEFLLRKFYNISINESLYIKKIDIIQEGMSTLKVEYNVYAKLFGNKLIKFRIHLNQFLLNCHLYPFLNFVLFEMQF